MNFIKLFFHLYIQNYKVFFIPITRIMILYVLFNKHKYMKIILTSCIDNIFVCIF